MEDSSNQNQGAGQAPEQNQNSSGAAPAASINTSSNSTLIAALSYIGPLVVVSYLMSKDSDFVKFHAKQGLVVFGIEVLFWILNTMMYGLWMVGPLVNLATLILSIIGIVNVVQAQKKELPLVGGLAKNFTF